MGEIAEMIIEGILCEECGVFIGDEVGYTRKCNNCGGGRKKKRRRKKKKPTQPTEAS